MGKYTVYAILYCIIVVLFMTSMRKESPDALTSFNVYGSTIYWILLTITSITLSLHILSEELVVMVRRFSS